MKARVLLIVAVVASMGLVGCSGDPEPTPTASTPAAGQSPTATLAPEPTPDPLAAPAGRLAVSCDDLVPVAERTPLLGPKTAIVSVVAREDSLYTILQAQVGAYSCRIESTDKNANAAVSMSIAVDRAAGFDKRVEDGLDLDPDDRRIGDASSLSCDQHSAGFFQCFYAFVENGYWIDGFYDVSKREGTLSSVTKEVRALLRETAASLADAEPAAPAWVAPESWTSEPECSTLDSDDHIRAALSAKGGTYSQAGSLGADDASWLFYDAYDRSGALECGWYKKNSINGFDIGIVPGSGWAYGLRHTDTADSIEVEGADAAGVYVDSYGSVYIDALVGATMLSSRLPEDTSSQRAVAVRGLAAAVSELPID